MNEPPRRNYPGGNPNLYIGNLSWEVSWEDLRDTFKVCGTIVKADVMLEPTGRSKGFGIVQYSNGTEAASAVQRLNNLDLKGRCIWVREDIKEGASNHGRTSQNSANVVRVFVGNLPWEARWQQLKDHFKIYMPDKTFRVNIIMEAGSNNTRSKGFAIIEFDNDEDAQSSIDLINGTKLLDRDIEVRADKGIPEPKPKTAPGAYPSSSGSGGDAFNQHAQGQQQYRQPQGASYQQYPQQNSY